MAAITLEYNSRNIQAQRTLEYILSMGFFKAVPRSSATKKSRIERSLEDIEKGKVFFLAGPKQI